MLICTSRALWDGSDENVVQEKVPKRSTQTLYYGTILNVHECLPLLCISLDLVCVDLFQNEYLSLVEQCMDFACELIDLCRGTQEVEAVLSEGSEDNGTRDPLARLKMAMQYEEKKVGYIIYRPNTRNIQY